ncbi:hypothetical protein [Lactobacillus corticis]|uniref:Uncharacterized protein n=1 Tax=Lactobacillus corticis TaxID=2201249 RepID=A0A916QKI3_9LACO|nr:hypothetical protein [Lactobacillus corticis]GFZ27588.1 hypothetical protein LCB40_14680 [Lactobacillus corticis]
MKYNLFTAIIVLIVGLYDLAYAFNRRSQPGKKTGVIGFAILGVLFTVGGIVMLVLR